MSSPSPNNALVMMVTGAAMLLIVLLMLVLMEDPFPMWLIVSGGGVMFIGVGSHCGDRRRPIVDFGAAPE